MKYLLAVLFVVLLSATSSQAALYKWKDDNGTLHFTDNIMKVPEEYRQDSKHKIKGQINVIGASQEPQEEVKESWQERRDRKKKERTENKVENKRLAERAAKEIFRMWQSESWDAIWQKGTQSSKSYNPRSEFVMRLERTGKFMKLTSSKVVSTNAYTNSIYVMTELNFAYKIVAPQYPGKVQKLKQLSMHKQNGQWLVSLYDIKNAMR